MLLASQQNPIVSIISLVICLVIIVANWKIFEKAGEPGWKAIIPFYNFYMEYKIFWGNGWLFLLTIIPIVNIVMYIILCNKTSKAFGHGVGFTLGLIFFPYIFRCILGYGSDEFLGRQ